MYEVGGWCVTEGTVGGWSVIEVGEKLEREEKEDEEEEEEDLEGTVELR